MRTLSRAAVAFALMLAATAAVLAQPAVDEFVPLRETRCWECHKDWVPPLKEMYNIVPPPQAGAMVGDQFAYTVQVQNPWLSELTYVEAGLDIAQAPSFRFAGGQPDLDVDLPGSIPVNPTMPTGPHSAHEVVVIPDGTTRLTVELIPDNGNPATGPDLRLAIYPGASDASGTPREIINNASNGGTERFEVATAQEFRDNAYVYGNWTFEARLHIADPAEPGLPGVPTNVPFRLVVHAEVDNADDTLAYVIRNQVVGPGQSMLLTWNLEVAAIPPQNETVVVTVNATGYYEHPPSANAIDEANFTRSLEILGVADGDHANLVTGAVIAAPNNSVTTVTLDKLMEAVGYAAAFLLVVSVWTGGMFGKASRRSLNTLFGSAKRRVAFHNVLSYGVILASFGHLVGFVIELFYYWTLGIIWGGIAIIAMVGLGVTGAMQVPMIRRWSYGFWRWSHYGLAIAALVFSLIHIVLDGANFSFIQEPLGWEGRLKDPFDPRLQ